MSAMTPAKRAKALGCKSLKQVASLSGVHRGVLARWYKSKPWLFDAVCEKAMRENWFNQVMRGEK